MLHHLKFCLKNEEIDCHGLVLDVTSPQIKLRNSHSIHTLNAAAALLVIGHVKNLTEGVSLARDTLFSGKALRSLDLWIHVSNRVKESALRVGPLSARKLMESTTLNILQ
ncbi:hypothetical protein H5410_017975, partial [Solanum commersonii]